MNFFFGQTSVDTSVNVGQNQQLWLDNTIFKHLKTETDTYVESGFALTLINDPKNICQQQSSVIHIDPDYVCASDCELYNKSDLITRLDLSLKASNEQIIISAWRKWGNLFPDRFEGKFSFILWDRTSRMLLAARDALGFGNFCYSADTEKFYFSSDLATLLDHGEVDKSINMKRFYQSFRYSNNPPEQTYFKSCHYCPPGHTLLHCGSDTSVIDYWKLTDKSFPDNNRDINANCETYVSLIKDALEHECKHAAAKGLMLSGGLDSSLLAAVLKQMPGYENSLTCYSYTFDKHKSCDESRYIKTTADRLNLESKLLIADQHLVFSDLQTRPIIKDMINLDSYASLPEMIFSQAQKDGKQIVILGHYGDDLFGGTRYKFADLITSSQYSQIIKLILDAQNKAGTLSELVNFGIRPLLPKSMKRLYRKMLPSKDTNPFAIEPHQVNNVDAEQALNDCRLFHHKNLLKLIYYSNTAEGIYYYRKHLYLGYGLRYVMPFLSKKMIEFFWTMPLIQLNKPGHDRRLQKQSLKLMNLDHIAARDDKTEFIELFASGIEQNRLEILKLLPQLALKDTMDLPTGLMRRLQSGQKITDSESGQISSYILAGYWWQVMKQAQDSYNQLHSIQVGDEISIKRNNLWKIKE